MNLHKILNAAVLIVATMMASSAHADSHEAGYGMGSGMINGYGNGWMEDTVEFGCRSCLSRSLPVSWDGSSDKRESEPTAGTQGRQAA